MATRTRLRLLYCAIDQVVPGTVGGSVHVQAVAEGLAALGHEVTALVAPGAGPYPSGPVHWVPMRPPLGRQELRWARARAITRLARRLKPDAVIERYYNFGGEGALAARAAGAALMLEVNAPVVDHPGSRKRLLDRALVVEPMRRWRDWQCRQADVIVTPDPGILPPGLPAARIVRVEWGADTGQFSPQAAGSLPYGRPPGTVAIFAGAFRAWHGAIHLVEALRLLDARGTEPFAAVFIGDGPELPRVRTAAGGMANVIFTGAVPHDRLPACLSAADIGVAPFDVAAHGPLSLGFYWSPLKIFEYMAAGLPVVAPAIPRLAGLVEHGREGVLYDAARPEALADALAELTDARVRRALGRAARERAVRDYSWDAHCRTLEAALLEALGRRS